MTNFVPGNERDSDSDLDEGWSCVDALTWNAPFTDQEKINVNMDEKDPLSFLKLFISDSFMEILVEQTNLYVERRITSRGPKKE